MIKKTGTQLNFRHVFGSIFNIIDAMSVDVGVHLKAVRQMYLLSQRQLSKTRGRYEWPDSFDRAIACYRLGEFTLIIGSIYGLSHPCCHSDGLQC